MRRSRWQRVMSEEGSTVRVRNSPPHRILATNACVIRTSITPPPSLITLTVASSIAKLTWDINQTCNVDVCQFSTVRNAVRSTGSAVSLLSLFSNSTFMHLNHKSNCIFYARSENRKNNRQEIGWWWRRESHCETRHLHSYTFQEPRGVFGWS